MKSTDPTPTQWPPPVDALPTYAPASDSETIRQGLKEGWIKPCGDQPAISAIAEIAPLDGYPVMGQMHPGEARQLIDEIKAALSTARQKLLALYEAEGWKALGYRSWRECVTAEFAQSESYLYQQLTAAKIARRFQSFVPDAEAIPESHLREVARLKPEQQIEAYQMALDLAGDAVLTAKLVRQAAAEVCPKALGRVERDYYPTDRRLTERFIRGISDTLGADLCPPYAEPCVGSGDISDCGWPLTPSPSPRGRGGPEGGWWTNDVDPARVADFHLDAAQAESWAQFPAARWVITNPPFEMATPIILNAWNHATEGVIALVRLSYLEPCGDRADLLRAMSDHLRVVVPCNPRPQFRGDTSGADQVTVCWLVWQKRHSWRALGQPCPWQFLTNWR